MMCLLEVENIVKHYRVDMGELRNNVVIKAVDDVSFKVEEGTSLGLIGESGSGKSTIAMIVLGLLEQNSGSVRLMNQELSEVNSREMKAIRKDVQIIFQYNDSVLDPQMTVGELLREPLVIHRIVPKNLVDKEVDRLLDLVGLSYEEKDKFPFQLSGGQNQRIMIARAIATRPKLIVCDEPVSALDVSVQGQILNLLEKLKKELNLTYLFISHDLKVVRHICDEVAVMYQGEIVEKGPVKDIFQQPQDQYTKTLLASLL